MKESKSIKCMIVMCLLVTIISACSAQATPLPEAVLDGTSTLAPTLTPTNTPTPSPTPSPTPTPLYYVRSDSQTQSTDPNTFTYVGTLFEDFDPAVSTSSGQIIQNVYETLVFYDTEKPDVFAPLLAESWEISPDGKTYTFHIREDVKFHNGDNLTPSDVAFSLQRSLLVGGTSSDQWLLTEPILGVGILDISQLVDPSGELLDDNEGMKRADPEKLKSVCEKVKSAIVADDSAGTVTVKLSQAWNAFLPTLAHPSASVMDAKWVGEDAVVGDTCWVNGARVHKNCPELIDPKRGWDGSCDTWQKFYGAWDTPFRKIENGTGPFTLTEWREGTGITLTRYDGYWQGPAKLQKINLKFEWNGNKVLSMVKSNILDGIWIQNDYKEQLEEFVGERCEYNSTDNIYSPCEATDESKPLVLFSGRLRNYQPVLIFNYNITGSYSNIYIGSARLDGKGIPSDFFSDVHIRKAFAYCFDWDSFIKDVYDGNAIQSTQLLLPNVIGFDPETPHYQFDLISCEKEFKLADIDKDGIPAGEDPDDLWEKGFQFKAIYTSGDLTESISEILSKNINTINKKFVVTPTFIPYETYYDARENEEFPFAVGGWVEDIHDPYNWYQPYTTGYFGKLQSLPENLKVQFEGIFKRALAETDPLKRAEIYKEASLLYYNEAVGFPLVLTSDDYIWGRWVEGMTLNPFFPRSYFYPIYKK